MGDLSPSEAQESRIPLLLGVSLKLYLDIASSREWARGVARVAEQRSNVLGRAVRLFALPSLPALDAVRTELAGSPVALGAQDLHWVDRGPFTGEVSGADLRDAGCEFVEVGHAERRALFGETDDIVGLKLAAAVRNGLTPVLCIGELAEGSAESAIVESCAQLASALEALDPAVRSELVVAYEPVWAIGKSRPAGVEHVALVVAALRRTLDDDARITASWVIYGGSAQFGSLTELGDSVDGLFMGRFAHDPDELARVIDEAAEVASQAKGVG